MLGTMLVPGDKKESCPVFMVLLANPGHRHEQNIPKSECTIENGGQWYQGEMWGRGLDTGGA